MCGITGFVEGCASIKYEGAVVLDRMCRIIAHRGPDDQGVMFRGGAALGMRRLSIIDQAGCHQPISC
jgi:asparagine synthase (glutamine-hydrolysing)